MVTDPVCGMQIDEKSAAGSAVHTGQRYYFCSGKCQSEFQANPAAFVKPQAGDSPPAHVHHAMAAETHKTAGTGKDVAKDPICGMVVDKATALKIERAAFKQLPKQFFSMRCVAWPRNEALPDVLRQLFRGLVDVSDVPGVDAAAHCEALGEAQQAPRQHP